MDAMVGAVRQLELERSLGCANLHCLLQDNSPHWTAPSGRVRHRPAPAKLITIRGICT